MSVLCKQITLTLQKTNPGTYSNQCSSSIIKTNKQTNKSGIWRKLPAKNNQEEQTEKLASELTEARKTKLL